MDQFISKLRGSFLRTYVFGDLLYDEFYNCEVNRLSPESPVPVLKTNDSRPNIIKPGGAGNVANQLSVFSDCTLFTFKDQYPIPENFEFSIVGIRTPRNNSIKRRFFDNGYMFPRWDIECEAQIDPDQMEEYRNKIFNIFINSEKPDIVFLSDYNKGFFSEIFAQKIIEYCNKNGIITIVDPKVNMKMWKGCTVLKMNKKEATSLSNLKGEEYQVNYIKDVVECNKVIVTNEGKGVYGDANISEDKLSEVKCVSGGGDVFLAFLGLSLALNFSVQESAKIAFDVGRSYVSNNVYNDIIRMRDLEVISDPIKSKIVTLEEFKKLNIHGKVVVSNGIFDMCHRGHLESLKYAKSFGDFLVVLVNSDRSTKLLKGEDRPIIRQEDRLFHLASLSYVDYVILFDDVSPESYIKQIKPDVLVKGSSYAKDSVIGKEYAKEIKLFEMLPNLSTSNIIRNIRKE